jgi:hypothetical protein
MTPPRKRAAKKPTPAPVREETVAEEEPVEQTDQTVADPPSAPVDNAAAVVVLPSVPAIPQLPEHLVVGLGPCRVCGAPGAVKADFPWTADKPVFCRKDCPPQYRFLLRG